MEEAFGAVDVSTESDGSKIKSDLRPHLKIFGANEYISKLEKTSETRPTIIISGIRNPGTDCVSPKFWTPKTFRHLSAGGSTCVILDLGMTEGGNVWGSRPDETLLWNFDSDSSDNNNQEEQLEKIDYKSLMSEGNSSSSYSPDYFSKGGVLIHSITGYPKRDAKRASVLYSSTIVEWIKKICEDSIKM